MYRKFHIDNFPENRIWLSFNEKFHYRLFKLINFKKINKTYFDGKLNYNTFKRWRHRDVSIPLWFILGLNKLLVKNNISIEIIEKNIVSYQGPSTSTPIKNPNLPLIEDERLIRIIMHILCDGWVGGAAGTGLPKGKGSCGYRNFEYYLIEKFKEDLSVFGKIKSSVGRDYILFPNVIRYILEKIYNIKFDTFSGRLPKSFFGMNAKLVSEVIKVFSDDEGHVYNEHIDFYSMNKMFLLDIKKIMKTYFPFIKTGDIKINRSGKNPKYYFYVLSESREEFFNKIGFQHPGKLADLEFNIKRVKMKKDRKPFVSKNKILNILSEKPSTAKEISRKIYIAHGTITEYLKDLNAKGKVKVVGKEKFNANVWSLSD